MTTVQIVGAALGLLGSIATLFVYLIRAVFAVRRQQFQCQSRVLDLESRIERLMTGEMQVPFIVWHKSLDGRLISSNAMFKRELARFGLQWSDVKHKRFDEIVDKEGRQIFSDDVIRATADADVTAMRDGRAYIGDIPLFVAKEKYFVFKYVVTSGDSSEVVGAAHRVLD